MRLLSVLLFCLAALTGGALAMGDPTDALDGVHDLDPSTFDAVVNGKKLVLAEFYAPWCGHCKHLTPELKALGEKVKADARLASRVIIAKVNADEHRSLGERFAVRGFPTLKLFKRGAPVDASAENYNGPRTAADMLAALTAALDADAGWARVVDLDGLAAAVAKAQGDDLAKAVDALKAAAAKLTGESAEAAALYTKAATKALDKGVDYFKAEHARLAGLIAKVSAGKADELARKMSVLTAFFEGEEDGSAAAA